MSEFAVDHVYNEASDSFCISHLSNIPMLDLYPPRAAFNAPTK